MYESYFKIVKEQLSKVSSDWNFKHELPYLEVVETLHKYDKNLYTELLKSTWIYHFYKKDLVDLCRKNDEFGKPILYDFPEFGKCGLSNFRYIYHAILILEHMKEKNLEKVDIIEIGGGYGGLCFFLYNLSKFFNITISSYSIFDQEDVIQLQQKYLQNLGITINTFTIDSFEVQKNSFLISNYALSKFEENIRNKYVEKVIKPYVKDGFLCWNFIPFYKFCDLPFKTTEEVPSTYPGNLYVYF